MCVAAEKGWIQPVSHKPLSSLRLLSGPGSPKKRAFTLDCACYSSQHSTHGHVSVFIALNINFHSHHVLCLHMIFSYSSIILFYLIQLFNSFKFILRFFILPILLQCSCYLFGFYFLMIYATYICFPWFLSYHILLKTLFSLTQCSVSFKHYVSNPQWSV